MPASRSILIIALSIALSGLVACGKGERSAAPADSIAAAIANPTRLAADTEEDAWRKPAEVLRFLQVRPGAHILDYFSAGGLEFEAQSPVLHNPADDRTKPVFDVSVRRKTDRFIYRFRKR